LILGGGLAILGGGAVLLWLAYLFRSRNQSKNKTKVSYSPSPKVNSTQESSSRVVREKEPELTELKQKFATPRRTQIDSADGGLVDMCDSFSVN